MCSRDDECPGAETRCVEGQCGATSAGPAPCTVSGAVYLVDGKCRRCDPAASRGGGANGCGGDPKRPYCETSALPGTRNDGSYGCVECLANRHCLKPLHACQEGSCSPLGHVLRIRHESSGAYMDARADGSRPVLRLDSKTLWSLYADDSGRGALMAQGKDGVVLALDGQEHSFREGCNTTLTPWEWDQVPLQIHRPLVFLRADEDRPLLPDEFQVGRRFRVLLGRDTVLRPDFASDACGCPGFGTRLQREGSIPVSTDVLVLTA